MRVEAPPDDVMVVVAPSRPAHAPAPKHGRYARGIRGRRLSRLELCCTLFLALAFSGIALLAMQGATRDGEVAACTASAREIGSAVAALQAENTAALPTTRLGWQAALLSPSEYVGGPFLGAWPRSGYYALNVVGLHAGADTGDGVVPASGDVVVTIRTTAMSYDATRHPSTACATA